MKIKFYYDVVCPFAYLASTRIEGLAARVGATLEWKPILLGGVYKAIGRDEVMSSPKVLLNLLDMQRYASLYGVFLRLHPQHPRRTVNAMRLLHTVPDGAERARLTHVLYRMYFVENRDPEDPETVEAAAAEIGCPELAGIVTSQSIKDALRATTDEAVQAGVFGVPSFLVEKDGVERLYWGQDRLRLFLPDAPPPVPQRAAAAGPREIIFYYDFSSPFSYLGATQVERMARAHGATVRWRPFLLGALFKKLGTPIVPLESFSAPKRAYYIQDLQDWAARWKVRIRWPRKFPMRTVNALRLAHAVDAAAVPELSRRLFHAYWVDDRDLEDDAVLAAIAQEAGIPGSAVSRALDPDPAVKQALFDATDEAARAGACGAPTFVVGKEIFWGQDRLDLVERALQGL